MAPLSKDVERLQDRIRNLEIKLRELAELVNLLAKETRGKPPPNPPPEGRAFQ